MTTQAQPKICLICGESKIICHNCGHGIIPEQPDQNTAYNAKVRAIAEQIAAAAMPEYWAIASSAFKERGIVLKTPIARAMVAEMQKMHYQGYITGLAAMEQFPEDSETNIDRRTQYFHSAAVRRGLIPHTKTDDNEPTLDTK